MEAIITFPFGMNERKFREQIIKFVYVHNTNQTISHQSVTIGDEETPGNDTEQILDGDARLNSDALHENQLDTKMRIINNYIRLNR